MQLSSRRALTQFFPVFSSIVNASDKDLAISDDLFAVQKFLSENSPLLRALTNPSYNCDGKKALINKLFSSQLNKASVEIITSVIVMRWGTETDLLEALETLGIESLILQADKANKLSEVEKDLFTIVRILKDNKILRNTLTDIRTYSVEQRLSLVDKLFSNNLNEYSFKLLTRAVVHAKRTGLSVYILDLAEKVANHTDRLLVNVSVAQPMTNQQSSRLQEILAKAYGKQIIINELIDKELIGGIRIRIGETVIDGSVLSSIVQARQRLAS